MTHFLTVCIITACLTGASSPPTMNRNENLEPRQLGDDCRPTVVLIGRLPGRMSKVWVLRCAATSAVPDRGDSDLTATSNRPR